MAVSTLSIRLADRARSSWRLSFNFEQATWWGKVIGLSSVGSPHLNSGQAPMQQTAREKVPRCGLSVTYALGWHSRLFKTAACFRAGQLFDMKIVSTRRSRRFGRTMLTVFEVRKEIS